MAKIIKNTLSEPTEITCPACLSVLSYTYQDIERVEEATLLPIGFRAIKRIIVCPVLLSLLSVRTLEEIRSERLFYSLYDRATGRHDRDYLFNVVFYIRLRGDNKK